MIFPLNERIERVSDDFGFGHFGATRIGRKHLGVDYVVKIGETVKSPINGTISKHGYVYNGDMKQRYIEIKCKDYGTTKLKVRIFYVNDMVELKTVVSMGDKIAVGGDISLKYSSFDKTMKNHIHFETIKNGKHVDSSGLFILADDTQLQLEPQPTKKKNKFTLIDSCTNFYNRYISDSKKVKCFFLLVKLSLEALAAYKMLT